MLVRIVKYWTYPDLSRQSPRGGCIWDGVHFTFDPVEECDFLLVLNEPREMIEVHCPREHVWALHQEPYVKGFFPWMREGHRQFSRVYTSSPPSMNGRYRLAPPLVPWHVNKSYDQLLTLSPAAKTTGITWVTSDLQGLPGHRLRYAFYQYLSGLGWGDLEVYGRGISPVQDKWEVLAKNSYAIAFENHQGLHYWTEKVADCWLAYALPFYCGCLNLEEYFPMESFIRIDPRDFPGNALTIRRAIDKGEYEKRLPAILEARERVLRTHQFFPFFSNEVRQCSGTASPPQRISIHPYRQGCLSRIRDNLYRMHLAGITHDSYGNSNKR